MAKKNYDELATKVVDLVGGKENISYFTHCITRLRFNVKDKGLVKEDQIKKISNVVGCQWSGDQLQIIIGQNVNEAYQLICTMNGLKEEASIDENLDKENDKKIVKDLLETFPEIDFDCIGKDHVFIRASDGT